VKIIVDMNLSPTWVEVLREAGFAAEHWSLVGDPTASDDTILGHARASNAVVFTHDLDFGRLLALTHASGPSVVQVRATDVTPQSLASIVIASLREAGDALRKGALITIDASSRRLRILPLTD
jgi:predicted nuclease of predicted toxin-antitoxin system